MKLLKKFWAALTAYPDSWDDYIPLGRWLIYKKLAPILAVLLIAAVAVLLWYLRPAPPAEIPVFDIGDAALKKYSGEAVLTEYGDIVYRGQVALGLRSGYGREIVVKDDAEETVYEGDFFQDRYQGEGTLFSDGAVLYAGGFQNGVFNGAGTLWSGDTLLYRGQFISGLYEGRGLLYQDGKKRYEGDFLSGEYDGQGTLFGADEQIVYTGGFRRGKYDGQGVELLANGVKRYEGAFRNGKYDGMGTLYHGARFQYRGEFVNGAPGPTGSIFNAQGQLLYSGPALRGQADYLALLGLPLAELKECVREVPSIYYRNGEAGFLYRELGFAAIVRYDYDAFQPPVPAMGGGDVPPELLPEILENGGDPGISLLTAPEDNLVANLLLVEGARIAGQIPADGTEAVERGLGGFQAFMASRVAADPMAAARFPAKVEKRGDHLYQVTELTETDWGTLKGVFQELVYYLWPNGTNVKGVPEVIFCGKAKFGG